MYIDEQRRLCSVAVPVRAMMYVIGYEKESSESKYYEDDD